MHSQHGDINRKSNKTNWLEMPHSTLNMYMSVYITLYDYFHAFYLFLDRMTPQTFPSLHLRLIGCTDRSAVRWRVCSTTHSACSHLAGTYIHTYIHTYIRNSGDNALSVEFMVSWPYRVAVSSPFTYVPLGLSLSLAPILRIRELNLLF